MKLLILLPNLSESLLNNYIYEREIVIDIERDMGVY